MYGNVRTQPWVCVMIMAGFFSILLYVWPQAGNLGLGIILYTLISILSEVRNQPEMGLWSQINQNKVCATAHTLTPQGVSPRTIPFGYGAGETVMGKQDIEVWLLMHLLHYCMSNKINTIILAPISRRAFCSREICVQYIWHIEYLQRGRACWILGFIQFAQ